MTCRARSLWPSEPHQVGNDLREAPLSRAQVEREGGQLVDDWDGGRIRSEVDAEQVAPAGVARFDPDVWKYGLVPGCAVVSEPALQPAHDAPTLAGSGPLFAEDREARGRVLAASGAGHPCIPPAALTARAEEKAAAGRQVLTRKREIAQLRRSTAGRAMDLVAHPDTRGRGFG